MGASTDPVYLRVLEDLRARIRDGTLEPGARVPSRNAIINRYGVGETAAKHALQVLATEGLIEARAGSGSYVRKLVVARHLEHDRPPGPGSPFGLDGRPQPAERQVETAVPPPHIARRLGLAAGAPAVATRCLETCDGEPVQLTISYQPADAAGLAADQVVEELSARPAQQAEAGALRIPAGATVMVVERVHLSGERAVAAADIIIPAERFRLRYRFRAPA
jgi:GntR family transcriptional regulator